MQILIFTDELATHGGWHGTQLAAALTIYGLEAIFSSLKDCVIDLSGNQPNIKIPGIDKLPCAAFVRGISGGTLQQITTRLNVLHALKVLGVRVYNDGRAIERTVDKAMTSFLLHQAGVPTPKTWVCESRLYAHEMIQSQEKLVIKPLFGSQGQGVRLVDCAQLPLPMDAHVDGVFYLQAFIKATHDYRVFVIKNKAVAAMKRTGETWLHNAALGAHCEKTTETDVLAIALQASSILDIAYCGVDVIRDENGRLLVLEVNSIPAWRGLQGVTEMNIAQALVDDLLSKI
jgi:tetrahydromethanopterin:alpha-L-glutamate ligase